ncbi:NUDIX hydrolase N-terminal domain-containing protein [Paenibacillus dendritiformis]|uniref:NUDIX hydrolase n=1 Tax=Paenibacillus dendritiformis C454 TaxID=1131935 RepID=H3SKN5_9BACL|nr:NUDIX hydrolase [Paenibacillus dendritiformis C454]
MIRTVLFDFDGTLADTLPLSLHAFRLVFQTYDKRSLTDHDIMSMFGPTEEGILAANLRHKGFLPQAIEAYYEHYRRWHPSRARSSEPVMNLLRELKARGLSIGVLTGKSRRSYDISVRQLGLDAYIDASVTGDDVQQPKPHPEGIYQLLQTMGLAPNEIVWVGDSEADIAAGRSAGVLTFAAQWFGTVQTRQFETQPNGMFRQPQELLDVISSQGADSSADRRWLDWTLRIQAIAQTGLAYGRDIYDRERYEELRGISVAMMADQTGAEKPAVELAFARDSGYATPKVDIRGVVFQHNRILLVKEKSDGCWALPGGWADVGLSPAEVAVKEIKEESGYDAEAVRLLAVLDKRLHRHPPEPHHVYKIFIQCRLSGGTASAGIETEDVRFFPEDDLPALSVQRNTAAQLHMLFQYNRRPEQPALFD